MATPAVGDRASDRDLLPHFKKNFGLSSTLMHYHIIIIDLRFINSGARKTISLYESFKSYCKTCKKYFKPDVFYSGHGNYVFGHGFRSWAVYQRLVLRLPFRLIAQNSLELFDEPITPGSISNIIKYFSDKYGDSEKILLSKIW